MSRGRTTRARLLQKEATRLRLRLSLEALGATLALPRAVERRSALEMRRETERPGPPAEMGKLLLRIRVRRGTQSLPMG